MDVADLKQIMVRDLGHREAPEARLKDLSLTWFLAVTEDCGVGYGGNIWTVVLYVSCCENPVVLPMLVQTSGANSCVEKWQRLTSPLASFGREAVVTDADVKFQQRRV